jgi:ferritin
MELSHCGNPMKILKQNNNDTVMDKHILVIDKFSQIVLDRAEKFLLSPINVAPVKRGSLQAVIQDAYDHGQKMTSLINMLMDLTIREKDQATNTELQEFVNGQEKGEVNTDGFALQLKLIMDNCHGHRMQGQEIAQHEFIW